MNELKPCPHCGDDAEMFGDGSGYYVIAVCDCVMKHDTVEEALERWNNRVTNNVLWHSILESPAGKERWIMLFEKDGHNEIGYYYYPNVGLLGSGKAYTHWRERVTPSDPVPSCIWTREDDPDERTVYQTACGDAHQILEGTPKENGYKYCPYCGGLIA